MIIQRYIVKEILTAFTATLFVLLLIVLGNTFVRLLGKVSGGSLPIDALGQLVLLQSVNGAIKLVPIALLIGMMLAFGRLYRDHEISAMHSAGIGPKEFYKGIFLFVAPLTLIIASLVLFVVPQIELKSQQIKKEIKQRPEASGIPVGEFMHANAGGKQITLFIEDIDQENVVMKRFFMHLQDRATADETDEEITTEKEKEDNILTAKKALLYIDPESGGRIFKIENGSRYDINKSNGEYTIFRFEEHGIHIPALKIADSSSLEGVSFFELVGNKDLRSHAEVHWRLALIFSVPVMALLAFPLSYTTPRQGRFGKLALGILLYAVYANLIITGQSMIEDGKIPTWLGLWWIHIAFIILSLWLVRRRYGDMK